ncbi:MAG: SNF2 helicase associated domain-containing protein [Chitinophagaceae bacterium]|nr:SNF2 helicase associated domain-containing protein [Oligoflexus sp.]
MNFSTKLARYFDPEIRDRGADYFGQGRVSYRLLADVAAHATVRGSRIYHCSYEVDQDKRSGDITIQMECDCPHFLRGNSCKHLWALALAIDRDPWGFRVAKSKHVAVEDFDPLFDPADEKATASIPWTDFKKRFVAELDYTRFQNSGNALADQGRPRALAFVLDVDATLEEGDLVLRYYYREQLPTGKLSVFKPILLRTELPRNYADSKDRELLTLFHKECDGFKESGSSYYRKNGSIILANKRDDKAGVLLTPPQAIGVLSLIDAENKLYTLGDSFQKTSLKPFHVSSQPWHFEARVVDFDKSHFRLSGAMVQGFTFREVSDFTVLAGGRYVVLDETLYPSTLYERKHQDWLVQLTQSTPVTFPKDALDMFVAEYSRVPRSPAIQWPAAFGWLEETVSPKPKLRLSHYFAFGEATIHCEIIFQYLNEHIASTHDVPSWIDQKTKKITLRDMTAEANFFDHIRDLPNIRPIDDPDIRAEGKMVQLYPKDLIASVETLTNLGWDIEFEGKRVSVVADFDTVVEGETDWFDLTITTKLAEKSFSVPELIRKRQNGELFIPLGDDQMGIIPDEWLRRFDTLSKFGTSEDALFRIPSHQALLLDSLLSEMTIDNRSVQLQTMRQKILDFKALAPVEPHAEFRGELRDYQKQGLAWLEFLQDFGFGGCLSDEMGLGKTIQVLAMLLRFHTAGVRPPTLVVVPRSLVTNWISEAQKFCPALVVRDMSGASRKWSSLNESPPQIVITTYGLLRQDIGSLVKHTFSYIILDESQTIKNPSSQAAKAAFLLRGSHKLAMSGTPIENHMSELMSLMRFLNPNLLNGDHWHELFKKKFDPTNPLFKTLTSALRPLMLRRTKVQVLKDLPPKIEDTLYCDLEGDQKKHYDELRDYYQRNLLPKLRDDTWRQSSIVVIEALLRLRQAACHSGLVDKDYLYVPSAKLEILFDKLQEIAESGHKALIFSQFTSFLKIVSDRFITEKIPFEYLDGQIRDRAARVERFQTDPKIPFFLISLKAGGVGLNLTAADYCFILDPWWNPAAESQAIDRAHRINQKNTVFAYRIIARDTVEEKIQTLQQSKKVMMESILEGEGSLIKEMDLKSIQSLFN